MITGCSRGVAQWLALEQKASAFALRERSAFSDRKKCPTDLFGTDIHHHGIDLAQDPSRVRRIENRQLRLKFAQQCGMLVMVQPKSYHGEIRVHPNPYPGESSLPQTVAHPLMIRITRRKVSDVLGLVATASAAERRPDASWKPCGPRLGATKSLWPAHHRFMRLLFQFPHHDNPLLAPACGKTSANSGALGFIPVHATRK